MCCSAQSMVVVVVATVALSTKSSLPSGRWKHSRFLAHDLSPLIDPPLIRSDTREPRHKASTIAISRRQNARTTQHGNTSRHGRDSGHTHAASLSTPSPPPRPPPALSVIMHVASPGLPESALRHLFYRVAAPAAMQPHSFRPASGRVAGGSESTTHPRPRNASGGRGA